MWSLLISINFDPDFGPICVADVKCASFLIWIQNKAYWFLDIGKLLSRKVAWRSFESSAKIIRWLIQNARKEIRRMSIFQTGRAKCKFWKRYTLCSCTLTPYHACVPFIFFLWMCCAAALRVLIRNSVNFLLHPSCVLTLKYKKKSAVGRQHLAKLWALESTMQM